MLPSNVIACPLGDRQDCARPWPCGHMDDNGACTAAPPPMVCQHCGHNVAGDIYRGNEWVGGHYLLVTRCRDVMACERRQKQEAK